jgi:hypothetical protein
MFRYLGMAAAVHAWLGRRSFLLVPGNIAALGLLGALTAIGARDLMTPAPVETPRRVTIDELASGSVPEGSYVTVDGRIDARYFVEITHRSFRVGRRPRASSYTEKLYPLVDDGWQRGVLVAAAGGVAPAGRLTVTGTVSRTSSTARDTLLRESALPSRMHPHLMLTPGRPVAPATVLAGAFVGLCPPLMAVLLVVGLRRGVIFRKDDRAVLLDPRPSPADQPIDMRVSGALRLDTGRPRWFVETQAQAVVTGRGDVALGAHIDASVRLLGMRVRNGDGFWRVVVPAGGIEDVTRGELAFGGDVRPAVKVTVTGWRRPVVLSFGGADQRQRFLQALEYYCGGSRRAA